MVYYLSYFAPQRERLAYKHLEIGRSLLKESSQLKGSTSTDALPWLQRSFTLIDRLDEVASSAEVSDVAELKARSQLVVERMFDEHQ